MVADTCAGRHRLQPPPLPPSLIIPAIWWNDHRLDPLTTDQSKRLNVQSVLERDTVTLLLTHKLSSVDVRHLGGEEPGRFWNLFHACFCQVRCLRLPRSLQTVCTQCKPHPLDPVMFLRGIAGRGRPAVLSESQTKVRLLIGA
jgi:hypothetical protein